jgi:hypothetical protein
MAVLHPGRISHPVSWQPQHVTYTTKETQPGENVWKVSNVNGEYDQSQPEVFSWFKTNKQLKERCAEPIITR